MPHIRPCATCAFYTQFVTPKATHFLCQRLPPQFIRIDEEQNTVFEFPEVPEGLGCGEWLARKSGNGRHHPRPA